MNRSSLDNLYNKYKHVSYIKRIIESGVDQGKDNEEIMGTIIGWLYSTSQQLQSDLYTLKSYNKENGYK